MEKPTSASDSLNPQPESVGAEVLGKQCVEPKEPGGALYRAAIDLLTQLKRAHRDYYRENPQAFRATVRRAANRVFRLKPGPKLKRDPRIGQAARRRARGTPWIDLYPVYIDHYREMTEYTRSYAEEGFRKKVNDYLRNHPRRKSARPIPPQDAESELKP